jgi:hypothetical protein
LLGTLVVPGRKSGEQQLRENGCGQEHGQGESE